jgi:hypothetical protein
VPGPPWDSHTASGALTATTATRRYWVNATSRVSAASSSAVATIAADPPGAMPSVAVRWFTSPVRARRYAPPRLTTTVPAVTSSSGRISGATCRIEAGAR